MSKRSHSQSPPRVSSKDKHPRWEAAEVEENILSGCKDTELLIIRYLDWCSRLRLRRLNKWWNAHAAPPLPPWMEEVFNRAGASYAHLRSMYMLLETMDWPTKIPPPEYNTRDDGYLTFLMLAFYWRGLTLRFILCRWSITVVLSGRYIQLWNDEQIRIVLAPNIILFTIVVMEMTTVVGFRYKLIDNEHTTHPDRIEFNKLHDGMQLRRLFIDELDRDVASRSFFDWILPEPLERLICSPQDVFALSHRGETAFTVSIPPTLEKWPDIPLREHYVSAHAAAIKISNTMILLILP